jgi:uncharacterized protein YraI
LTPKALALTFSLTAVSAAGMLGGSPPAGAIPMPGIIMPGITQPEQIPPQGLSYELGSGFRCVVFRPNGASRYADQRWGRGITQEDVNELAAFIEVLSQLPDPKEIEATIPGMGSLSNGWPDLQEKLDELKELHGVLTASPDQRKGKALRVARRMFSVLGDKLIATVPEAEDGKKYLKAVYWGWQRFFQQYLYTTAATAPRINGIVGIVLWHNFPIFAWNQPVIPGRTSPPPPAVSSGPAVPSAPTPPGQPMSGLLSGDPAIHSVTFRGIVLKGRMGAADVRGGPGSNYGLMGRLQAGTSLTFIGWREGEPVRDAWTGKPDNRWFVFRTNSGQLGYVASGLVYGNPPQSPTTGPQDPQQGAAPPSEGHDTSPPAAAPNGAPIHYENFSGVVLKGRPGDANVRSGPGTDYAVLGQLGSGTALSFMGWCEGQPVKDMWTGQPDNRWFIYRRDNGQLAFIASGLVYGNPQQAQAEDQRQQEELQRQAQERQRQEQEERARRFPDTSPAGTPIRYVEFDGTVMRGKAGRANVRFGPGTNFSIMDSLPAGTGIHFIGVCEGESVRDLWTGRPDSRWFIFRRDDDQLAYIASGLVYGNPP